MCELSLEKFRLPSYQGKIVQFKTKLKLEVFLNGETKETLWFPVIVYPPKLTSKVRFT